MDPLLTTSRGRGYPRGFSCGICAYVLVILLWTLVVIFYFSYVHMALVFTQTDTCGSFTALSTSDVPFYSYPSSPAVDPALSELYCSFQYYLWASDYLVVLLPVWVLAITLLSVLFQSRTPFAVGVLATLVGLIELAKAIYWTLYLTNALACDEYQYCVNRDPSQPPESPNAQFFVATILAYFFAVGAFALIGVEGVVRSARLPQLPVGKKFDGNDLAFGARATAVTRRQQPRRRSKSGNRSERNKTSARSDDGVRDYPINV